VPIVNKKTFRSDGPNTMPEYASSDFYELLQISPNAEPETVHRVYRLLAQRWHPDNQRTGNVGNFRAIQEAYEVLSNPEKRAQYDVGYLERRQARWPAVLKEEHPDNDFDMEEIVRLLILGVLYRTRRAEPQKPGIFVLDLEELTGTPREHLEFTIWYLLQKNFVQRTDNSFMAITAEGVDYFEMNEQAKLQHRRLAASSVMA
jgi:curved DNA-binding protein